MIIKPEWRTNTFENEMQFQAALVRVLSQEFPHLRYKVWHTKNEGYIERREGETDKEYETRKLIEGNRNKAQGMVAGIPDLLIRYRGITYGIELKQPKGDLNHAQMIIHDKWKEDCSIVAPIIVYTIEQAVRYCEWIISNDLHVISLKNIVSFIRNISEDIGFYNDKELTDKFIKFNSQLK